MGDSEKPFACTEPGCQMSFTNEDHLTVHKKKHDMMLNLGINNKNIFFIADQTPTPTRFIRSCEEVGLFQDLQNDHDHDNPFEQTFRRAVEAGKSIVLTAPEIEDSDTLNTPNIFPPTTEESATSISATLNKNPVTTSAEIINLTESPTTIQSVSSKEIDVINKNELNNQKNIESVLNENIVVQTVPNTTLVSESIIPAGPINGAEILVQTQDGKVLKLVAAPVVEVQANNSIITDAIKPVVSKEIIVTSQNPKIIDEKKIQGAVVKMKLKQTVLTKNNGIAAQNKILINQNEIRPKDPLKDSSVPKPKRVIVNVKKQAILERNRASSMRARAKKKVWIEQLQNSLKLANEKYNVLQNQMKNLNAQVVKLKALLLAHKDCPVTKAMEKENGMAVGSKILTINPDNAKAEKRPSPIVPKSPKKMMLMSTNKSPMILPKISPVANTITLHGVDGIKTIPAINITSPFITRSDVANAIIIKPDSRTVSLMQENGGFRVVDNFEQTVSKPP